ncbi:MAG: hypothetical protein ACRC7W_06460 [Fusobacteriaceae bacterium]
MQLKYFLEEQNKVNELYLKKFPQERTELNIKLSIYSEIMEFIQALGMAHKKEESVERQKEELMDCFMFCLEALNKEKYIVNVYITQLYEKEYKSRVVENIGCIVETFYEYMNLKTPTWKFVNLILCTFFCFYRLHPKEFKELFDKKIAENLVRFK